MTFPGSHEGTRNPRRLHSHLRAPSSFPEAEKCPDEDVCFSLLHHTGLDSESQSPQALPSASHLPLDFLRNLLDPQLVVLRQELQLFVNKPQPLLPLLTHFQAVNPERKGAGYKTQVPTD